MNIAIRDWKQTEATVETSLQHHCEIASAGGFVGREYAIAFRYEVNGHSYSGEFESTDPWEPGRKFCISYNPAHPEINTMCDRSGNFWVYVVIAIIGILAFIAYFWVRHQRLGY